MQILKTWNIRLLESITYNPQQLNQISSVLYTTSAANEGRKGKGKSMSSKSFRSSKQTTITARDPEPIRRADSFSKLHTYRTDINGLVAGSSPSIPSAVTTRTGLRIGGLPPLPREANVRSWGGPGDQYGTGGLLGSLSQDSSALNTTGLIGGSPPPLPPRPSDRIRSTNYRGYDDEDPDYAYIKEDEVKGPLNSSPSVRKIHPTTSVDDVLQELERDIMREKQAKKLEEEDKKRRAKTLGRPQVRPQQDHSPKPLRLGPPVVFPAAEPQDYMDFVPSKTKEREQTKSSSSEPERIPVPVSHTRSASEPEPHPFSSSSKTLSQIPVFEDDEDQVGSIGLPANKSHTQSQQNFNKPTHLASDRSHFEQTMFSVGGSVPSLPPRTWRNPSPGNLEGNPLTGSQTSESSFSSGVSGGTVMRGGGENDSRNLTFQLSEKANTHGQCSRSPSHSPSSIRDTHTHHTSDTHDSAVSATAPSPASPTATTQGLSTPPPLPPRSLTKDRLSRKSSSSSTSSNSSTRCPHCRGSRKHKTVVGKTVSLGAALGGNLSPDDCRKSMPDLAGDNKSVPENGLRTGRHRHGQRSRHCSKCSPESSIDTIHDRVESTSSSSLHSFSATNFEYLQLVGEEQGRDGAAGDSPTSAIESELEEEMDLLSSCLKKLEYLEHEVNKTTSSVNVGAWSSGLVFTTPTSSDTIPNTSLVFSPSSNMTASASMGSRVPIAQSIPSSRVTPHLVHAGRRNSGTDVRRSMESELTRARRDTQLTLAGLSQPISQTHLGISGASGRGIGLLPIFSQSSDTKTTLVPNGNTTHHHSTSANSGKAAATRGHQANGMVPQRSASSMGLVTPPSFVSPAPPTVPPRSMVSLMQTTPTSKQQLATPSQLHPSSIKTTSTSPNMYGKKSVSQSQLHQPPVRSFSNIRSHSAISTTTRHPSLARRRSDHIESQSQSSTVFIHHLKDRRSGLTHLV